MRVRPSVWRPLCCPSAASPVLQLSGATAVRADWLRWAVAAVKLAVSPSLCLVGVVGPSCLRRPRHQTMVICCVSVSPLVVPPGAGCPVWQLPVEVVAAWPLFWWRGGPVAYVRCVPPLPGSSGVVPETGGVVGSLVVAGPSWGAARPGVVWVGERVGDAVSLWRCAFRSACVPAAGGVVGSLVVAGPSRGAARPGAACVGERVGDAASPWRCAFRTAFVLHQPTGEEGSVVEASAAEGGGVLVSARPFALRWRKGEAADGMQCARALCVETACVETSCGELGHVCGP